MATGLQCLKESNHQPAARSLQPAACETCAEGGNSPRSNKQERPPIHTVSDQKAHLDINETMKMSNIWKLDTNYQNDVCLHFWIENIF